MSSQTTSAQRYEEGDYGQGIRIGVAELEPNLTSDIAAYKSCYGLSTKVNYIKVDGGAGSGAGSGEAALDIEMLAGLAPKATIDVYQAPNTDGGFYGILTPKISQLKVTGSFAEDLSLSSTGQALAVATVAGASGTWANKIFK